MTVSAASAIVLLLVAQSPSRSSAPSADRASLLQQADAARAAGRRPEAMRLFALAGDRGSARGWLELARLQSGDGDAAEALRSLDKARALAPNSEDVLSAIAQVSLAARRPVPAILTLEALTHLVPDASEYHYLLGVALMTAGDMPAAVESLQVAARLEPDRALTLIALGLALNSRKLYDEARAALTRSLELMPDSTDALAALAEADAGMGNLTSAEARARRVIERDAINATANLVLGMVLTEQRQYPAAREALLRAIASDPRSPKAYYQLSLVYARLGEADNSAKFVVLYQEKLREIEQQVTALRTAGVAPAGRSK